MAETGTAIQGVNYKYKRSRRARILRLCVKRDGAVVLTVPWHFPAAMAKNFITANAGWIKKKINEFAGRERLLPGHSRRDYLRYKKAARLLVEEKLARFNTAFGFKYGRISIKSQKTRWGSCSRRGNLNFNYRIVMLPEDLADYIIVHELCHLKEMNHSRRFWQLVGVLLPDYDNLRKKLRNIF